MGRSEETVSYEFHGYAPAGFYRQSKKVAFGQPKLNKTIEE